MRTYLAVDIGASSGRHILGWVEDGRIRLERSTASRTSKVVGDHDCWDIEALWGHILAGLKACRERGRTPDFMGIDTWAVDFVLVDGARTAGEQRGVLPGRPHRLPCGRRRRSCSPFAWLYERTGIQYQPFNTIYQLLALRQEHPGQLEAAERFLMLPDYFHYLLTGRTENEYTNATSTALVSAHTGDWDGEILSAAGLPRKLFGPLRTPGTVLGRFYGGGTEGGGL